MMKITKLVFGSTLAAVLIFTSAAGGQRVESAAASVPMPAQIGSGHRAFIANGGTLGTPYAEAGFSGGADRAYSQFYAGIKAQGSYELVAAPAEADLVFEINVDFRVLDGRNSSYFHVVVLDPKTRVTLWTINEWVEVANLKSNRDKNFDKAMENLLNDVKRLSEQSAGNETSH